MLGKWGIIEMKCRRIKKNKGWLGASLFIMMLMLMVGCGQKKDKTLEVNGQEMTGEEYLESLGKLEMIRGEILEKIGVVEKEDFGFTTRTETYMIKITEGDFKGEVVEATNIVEENTAYNLRIEDGQKHVMLRVEVDDQGSISNVYIAELVRDKYMVYLVIIFVLMMLIVGGLKGFKSLITLVLISLSIFKFLLPRVLEGQDPILLTVLTATFVIITTILIISGFNRKSTASIVGTIGGVLCAAAVAYTFETLANLTGLAMDEAQALMFIPQGTAFNFKGLFLAGILLGALGAVMDVSMSIASSIQEIYLANRNVTIGQLFKSGMNVGKDIMGTMSNTLILAYTGASMNLILLLMAHQIPIKEIMNRDIIASEIVRGLTGTIGLIFTIPITAIIAATLYKKGQDQEIIIE